MAIRTQRLTLRSWRESDREPFVAMHADPEVMRDLGGSFEPVRAQAKFDRYAAAFEHTGLGRWAITGADGRMLGYAGIMLQPGDHPLGAHHDIGWRLIRSAWGYGYASEAAAAALRDGFERLQLREVFAYTSAENARSQAVMARLELLRDAARDFTLSETGWKGLVWIARPRD